MASPLLLFATTNLLFIFFFSNELKVVHFLNLHLIFVMSPFFFFSLFLIKAVLWLILALISYTLLTVSSVRCHPAAGNTLFGTCISHIQSWKMISAELYRKPTKEQSHTYTLTSKSHSDEPPVEVQRLVWDLVAFWRDFSLLVTVCASKILAARQQTFLQQI